MLVNSFFTSSVKKILDGDRADWYNRLIRINDAQPGGNANVYGVGAAFDGKGDQL